MKILLKIFIILMLAILVGCDNFMKNPSFNYDSMPTNHDRLLIEFVVKEYMNSGFDQFHAYPEFKNVSFFIDRVYYSPDSLKFIGWVVSKIPSWNFRKDADLNEISHSGSIFIGIKEQQNELWKIYLYPFKAVSSFSNPEGVRNVFNNYFFWDLKRGAGYSGFIDNDTWDIIYFKHNLDDEGFWEGEFFDTSYNRGKYSFEIRNWIHQDYLTEKERKSVVLPELNYPDTILQLYKFNKN